MDFVYEISLSCSQSSLKCLKLLGNGTAAFTCPPKERLLLILMAFKNPTPRLGFNPQKHWIQWQAH
jgi:hypothetical protein